MGKDVSWTAQYPSSAGQAFAILTSESFLTALAKDTGSLASDVHCTANADGSVTVTNSRTFPAEVPAYAKSMVGDTITVVEVQNWGAPDASGARTGTFEVNFGNAPVKFNGELALSGDSPCSTTTTGTVKASIPLVGGKIESLVVEQIGAYMEELEAHAKAALT